MTFKELQDLFQLEFGEIVPKTITAAFRNKLLNLGQRDVARKTECLNSVYTASSVADQATYGLSSEMAMSGLMLVAYDGNELHPSSRPLIDTSSGTPSYYYLLESTLGLWPIPDTSGKEIKVVSVEVPSDMSATTDVSVLPLEYHDLIKDYALYRALEWSKRFDEATVRKQAYLEGIAEMKQKLTYQHRDKLTYVMSMIRKIL